ncbi:MULTISPECIES: hypothetical protein [Streptomyces]|uniref:hypothetical protein n=1 Tax=Streptomyces TaxID=1883 RepID=UPI002244A74A|nr:hypothetical protein [Streptomyces griseolus]MCW8215429.1 hypothetical protein [Streptomyces griseolus]
MATTQEPEPPSGPEKPQSSPHPMITYIGCAQCGTEIAGLDGRYSCSGCGWVNEWSDGHRPLPEAPPYPG